MAPTFLRIKKHVKIHEFQQTLKPKLTNSRAMKTLEAHGSQGHALFDVTRSTLVALSALRQPAMESLEWVHQDWRKDQAAVELKKGN